ncbi:MAG: heme oxygenase (biliverdin-producing) [Sarcina sp.]
MMNNNFAMTMRTSNKNLHTAAEKTGFNARLVEGRATRESYAEYLFNLKVAYEAIERNLDKYSNVESLKPFVTKDLYRATQIEKDLEVLAKGKTFEVLPSAKAYAARIDELGEKEPMLLVAHAYTRFLADLFGGRTIFQIVKDSYKIEDEALNYFMFPEVEDSKMRAMAYIGNLSKMELSEEVQTLFLNEIANAYLYNIGISTELDAKLFMEDPHAAQGGHGHTGHPHGKMPAGHPEVKPGMKMPEGHPHIGGHPHGEMPAGHPHMGK